MRIALWTVCLFALAPAAARADDERWYAGVEVLHWWLREGRIPPLLTTSSPASGGVLGQPDTEVLYGGDRLETRHGNQFLGGRFTLGCWLTDDPSLAVEVRGFFLERDSTYFKATSPGDPLLAIPYINANNGQPTAEIVAGLGPEGLRNGAFNGFTKIEVFGEEINLVTPVSICDGWDCVLLGGLRLLQMRDRADFTATGRLLPDQAILFGVSDHFRVHNYFWGGQLGLRVQRDFGDWFIQLEADAALGATSSDLSARGDRTRHTPVDKTVEPFGLFVRPSNAGKHSHCGLDAVFDLEARLGYRLTDWLSASLGGTFLAWLNPVRAGDQVDTQVNLNQPVGPDRPRVPFRSDFFWAAGLNAAVKLRW
jgi:hypothetical protein